MLAICCGGLQLDKYWFTKNPVAMTFITLTLCWGVWSLVSGKPWMGLSIAIVAGVISMYTGVVFNIQYLRDVVGYQKSTQITMPIQFGLAASIHLFEECEVPMTQFHC